MGFCFSITLAMLYVVGCLLFRGVVVAGAFIFLFFSVTFAVSCRR